MSWRISDSDFQTLEPEELFTEKSKVEQNSEPMEKDTWIYPRHGVSDEGNGSFQRNWDTLDKSWVAI